MDIQKLMDTMSDGWRRDRSRYHLTLGGLIAALEAVEAETPVQFDSGGAPAEPDSYRGYYSDLAFCADSEARNAGEVLADCKSALGGTFTGYKGGEFVMEADTPLWVAPYGCCGPAIVDTRQADGKLILVTKDVD